jgi:hypothetical protein
VAPIVVVLLVLTGAGVFVLTSGDDPEAAVAGPTSDAPGTSAVVTTTTEPVPVLHWPLTGLPGADTAGLARPALVVKIDNLDGGARPQVGINQADVVYEERVESGVTRFLAVFHSTDAAPIGPVRSGRTTDIPVFSALNRPMFAWSGSNELMAADIRAADMVDVGHTPAVDQYSRDGSRRAPHNLFIQGYRSMVDSHRADAGVPPALFTFRPEGVPAVGEPVTGVEVAFGGSSSVRVAYAWDGTGWARTQNGTPHVDGAGVVVAPANVVVQFVEYGRYRGAGPPVVAELVGEGEVWVFTGGQRIVGRWVKPSLDAVTQYLLPDGTPIGLTPGRTWVELPPPGSATVS